MLIFGSIRAVLVTQSQTFVSKCNFYLVKDVSVCIVCMLCLLQNCKIEFFLNYKFGFCYYHHGGFFRKISLRKLNNRFLKIGIKCLFFKIRVVIFILT